MVRQRLTSLTFGPGVVILLVALTVCVALLPVTFLLGSSVVPVHGHRLLNVTLGAVWCPHSIIVGWTLGHDWSYVTNVVTCPPGSLPAAWLQVWWRNGVRNVICLDFARQRC